MKCIWCGEKEADGIAVIGDKPCYCKECQLKLLKKYGCGRPSMKLIIALSKVEETTKKS